jgi:hypothetical protein
VELFNTTPHWVHRERADGLRTPVEVLSWVRGAQVNRDVLQHALRRLQIERVVTLRGYVSAQRFYLYAERGLSRRRVSVWLHEGRLHIAYRESALAQYVYRYDRKARRLGAVSKPRLFHTAYTPPQLELWELDDEQWRKTGGGPMNASRSAPKVGSGSSCFHQSPNGRSCCYIVCGADEDSLCTRSW